MPPTVSLGHGRWKLAEPWDFSVGGLHLRVPEGFLCDLFSVPFPLSILIPKDEKDNRPALIHDYLYATVGLRATCWDEPVLNREMCDALLREACRQCEFPRRRIWSIHTGVRLGGFKAWHQLASDGYSLQRPKMD